MQRAQLGEVLLLARLAWQPTGLRINMMPIVIGDVETLPQECRPYLPLLRMCPVPSEEWGPFPFPAALPHTARPAATTAARPFLALSALCVWEARRVAGEVGYLTIDESVVEEGASQRRGGLSHRESRRASHGGNYRCNSAATFRMRKLPHALHTLKNAN